MGPLLDPGTGGTRDENFSSAIAQAQAAQQQSQDFSSAFAAAVGIGNGASLDPGFVDRSAPTQPLRSYFPPPIVNPQGNFAQFDPGYIESAPFASADFLHGQQMGGGAASRLFGDATAGAPDADSFDFSSLEGGAHFNYPPAVNLEAFMGDTSPQGPINWSIFNPDAKLDPSQIEDRRGQVLSRAGMPGGGVFQPFKMPDSGGMQGLPTTEPGTDPFLSRGFESGGGAYKTDLSGEYESVGDHGYAPEALRAFQRGGSFTPDDFDVLTRSALAKREQAQDEPPGGGVLRGDNGIESYTPEQVAQMGPNAPELQQPYFLNTEDRGPVLTKPIGYADTATDVAGRRIAGKTLSDAVGALNAPERMFRAFVLDHNLAPADQTSQYRLLRDSGMNEQDAAAAVRTNAELAYADAEKGAMWSGAGTPVPTFGIPVLLNALDPRNDPRVRELARDQLGGAISSAILDPTNLIDLAPGGFFLLAAVRGSKMSGKTAIRDAILEALRTTPKKIDDPEIIKTVEKYVANPEAPEAKSALDDLFRKINLTPPTKEDLAVLTGTPPTDAAAAAKAAKSAFEIPKVEGVIDDATRAAAHTVEANPERAKIVAAALDDIPSHASHAQRTTSLPNQGAEMAKIIRDAFRGQVNITPQTFLDTPTIREQLRGVLSKAGGNAKSNVQLRDLADGLIQRERIAVLANKAETIYTAALASTGDRKAARKIMDDFMDQYAKWLPDGRGNITDIVEPKIPKGITIPGASGGLLALPAPGQTATRTTKQMADRIVKDAMKTATDVPTANPMKLSPKFVQKELARLRELAQEPLRGKEDLFARTKRMRAGLPEPTPETIQSTTLKEEFRRLTSSGLTDEEALRQMFPPGTAGYVINGETKPLRAIRGAKDAIAGAAGTPTGYRTAEQDMRLREFWNGLTTAQKVEFVWSSGKSLLATGDLGWTLRQGGGVLMATLTGGDVKGALRQIGAELKAFRDPEFAEEAIRQLVLSEDYPELRRLGLDVQFFRNDQDWLANMAGKSAERNEVMQVSLAHFINPQLNIAGRKIGLPLGEFTRASERAGVVYLNMQRVETARAFLDLRRAVARGEKGAVGISFAGKRFDTGIGRGVELSETNAKDFMRFDNALVGRGTFTDFLERVPGAPMLLSLPFFAPRWVVSRFQIMVEPGIPLFRGVTSLARGRTAEAAGHFTTAGQEAQIVAKWWVGTAALIKTAQLAGWNPEMDPLSTNFGTIALGDTGMRVDLIPGGMRTVFVFLAREIENKTKSGSGVVRQMGSKDPYATDRWSLAGDFIQGKFNVPLSVGHDLIQGQTFGDPYGPFARNKDAWDRLGGVAQVATDTMIPLPIGTTVQAILQGGPLGAIFAGTEFIGLGSLGTATDRKKAERDKQQAAQAAPQTTPRAPTTAPPELPVPAQATPSGRLRR